MPWFVVKTNAVANNRPSWRDWVIDPTAYRTREAAEGAAATWPKDGPRPLVVQGDDLAHVMARARRGDFFSVS